MDAKRHCPAALCAIGLIFLTGCELGMRAMKADNPRPVEPTEKPIIVRDQGVPVVSQGTDPNEEEAKRFIERVDDIYRQARRSDASSSAPDRDPRAAESALRRRPVSTPTDERTQQQTNPTSDPTNNPSNQTSDQLKVSTLDTEVDDSVKIEPSSPSEPIEVAPTDSQGPPVLAALEVRGARNGAARGGGPANSPPAINAPTRTAESRATLKDALEEWLAESSDGSFADQMDARLVHVLSGDYEAARDPLADVSDERQQLASGMIDALIAIREGHDGDPSAAANTALKAVERLAGSLRRNSDLEIPVMALCRSVDGFGRYDQIASASFVPGSEFVSYCEVRNFHSERADDDTYQTRFSMRTTIMSRGGDTVLDIKDANILDRCRNLRRDCFLSRVVRLPATLSPGEYVAKITLVDKLGEKVAESRTTFKVVAGLSD